MAIIVERTEPARDASSRDAIDLLILFHGEVRERLAELAALAASGRVPERARLKELARFFVDDVALHDLDEEASLLPRLRRVAVPERLQKQMTACTHQHEHLEETLEHATPYLVAIAEGNEAFSPERLAAVHRALSRALEPHMHMEEQDILPLARTLLDEKTLAELKSEMLSRRRARRDRHTNAIALEDTP